MLLEVVDFQSEQYPLGEFEIFDIFTNFDLCFRGENILLFLVQRVGRQLVEQRQYRPSRGRVTTTRKTALSADLGKQWSESY